MPCYHMSVIYARLSNTEDTEEKKTIKEFVSESKANIERLKKILTVQPKEQLQSEH